MKPFEEIVAAHGPTVLRVCRALLGSADADDAWSETFLSALKAYPQLDPGANVEAWLVTIAHRKAIDALRAKGRRPVPVADMPEEPTTQTDAGWDDDLWGALKALPTKQRQAIAYHHLAGLPHRQVAEIIGGSEAAARRSAADGIANLRKTYLRAELEKDTT
ncbi:MAG: RNA polymerase sigma factor [Nocardioidaceae bacterium]